MRSICVVTQQYKSVISGIGLHARNLLAGLQRDGHQVTLLTQASQQCDPVPRGVQVLTVPVVPLQGSQARWVPLAWRFSRRLKRVSAVEHFDLVHFTDAREAMLFAAHHPAVVGNVNDYYAARLYSLGYYRRHYTDYWKRWPYYVFVNQCERVGLRRLSAIVVNSDFTGRAIQQAYKLDRRRLFKCYKCIDLSLFDRVLPVPRESGLILFVGGNMQRKGLETLIRAAPHVVRERPDVEFCVVGRDPNLPAMQALCHELGVGESFQFRGWMSNDELRSLYHQAGVFVMPSLMEAFGVVFLEAMACGVPVVGTRVGGVPELVQHDHNGLLVEPDDPDGLSSALLAVLRDPELTVRLTRNGLHTAQQFGIEQMLACTYRVYERVIGESL